MSLVLRNKLFPGLSEDFFDNDFFSNFLGQKSSMSMPAVNISEDADSFRIEVAAPGLDKKDFRIEVKNNLLTISSEKQEKQEANEERYMRREFNYCAFKRSFGLPQTVDSDNIKAKHSNGILNVVIPKKEEAKEKPMRQIEIK